MSLLAGADRRDLCPPGPVPLFGYPGVERVSTGVHDPVLATALYMENAGQALVLISLDLLFLEPPAARRLRREVAAACRVPECGVMIACTHTHSAPVCGRIIAWKGDVGAPEPDPDYLALVSRRTVEAALGARARAEPAALAWTAARTERVGGNRLRPDGPADPECTVLGVRSARRPVWLAAALVYAMHPTVLHEDSTLISSDFPHYARQVLSEGLAGNPPVLYLTAPCGDQSPRWFVGAQSFAEAERLGGALGRAALLAARGLDAGAFDPAPPLGGAAAEAALPRRPLPTVPEAEALLARRKAEFERLRSGGAGRAVVRTAECAVFGAQSALCLARAQASGALDAFVAEMGPPELQAVRAGRTALLGLPGELFVDYGREIKRRSSGRVVPVSLVNGELQGYICTPEAEAAGGYEASNSLYAPEAGSILVEAGLAMAGRLLEGP